MGNDELKDLISSFGNAAYRHGAHGGGDDPVAIENAEISAALKLRLILEAIDDCYNENNRY